MKYRCGHCQTEFDQRGDAETHAWSAHSTIWMEGLRPDGVWHTVEGGPPRPAPTEGRKDDQSKNRLDLIPPELIFAVGDILTFGAAKYADRNWERGMKWSRVFGALMRHMWAWWAGAAPTPKSFVFGDLDMETGKSHLWHAGCCIAFLIAYEERGTGTDDRWTGS
jgi:hypothetical protein